MPDCVLDLIVEPQVTELVVAVERTLLLEMDAPVSEILVVAQPAIELVLEETRTLLLETCEQGPPGAAAEMLTKTAVQPLGGHRVVVGVGAVGCDYADAQDATQIGRVLGITENAAAAGEAARIRWAGEMSEPGWSWTPDVVLWLGANGALTQMLPETQGVAFAQRLGVALTANKIFVQVGEPVCLGG